MDKPTIVYKLKRVENLTLPELKEAVSRGARFIVFPYTISFIAITFTPFSQAYLVREKEDPYSFGRKYSILTGIAGWWGIPDGIMNSIKSLEMNRKGGLDVTEDILLNLTEESLQNQEVKIQRIGKLFIEVQKSDKKQIIKALKRFVKEYPLVEEVVIGMFINTEEGESPIFIIGLPAKLDDEFEHALDQHIRRYFYKHVPFWYVSTQEDSDLVSKLLEQGERVEIKHSH